MKFVTTIEATAVAAHATAPHIPTRPLVAIVRNVAQGLPQLVYESALGHGLNAADADVVSEAIANVIEDAFAALAAQRKAETWK